MFFRLNPIPRGLKARHSLAASCGTPEAVPFQDRFLPYLEMRLPCARRCTNALSAKVRRRIPACLRMVVTQFPGCRLTGRNHVNEWVALKSTVGITQFPELRTCGSDNFSFTLAIDFKSCTGLSIGRDNQLPLRLPIPSVPATAPGKDWRARRACPLTQLPRPAAVAPRADRR